MKFKTLLLSAVLVTNLIANTYAFTDVSINAWYKSYLDRMTSQNIINGYEDNTFRPSSDITIGELLKIIAITTGNSVEHSVSQHWADGYLKIAYNNGYIKTTSLDLDAKATRNFVAEIIYNVVNVGSIKILSPFVDVDSDIINTLYTLGILTGSQINNQTYFLPNDNITRAEISAIICRVLDVLENKKTITKKTYKAPAVSIPKTLETTTDFENLLLYMTVKNVTQYTYKMSDTGYDTAVEKYGANTLLSKAFSNIFDIYPEYFSFNNKITSYVQGTISSSDYIIELKSNYYADTINTKYKTDFLSMCENVVYALELSVKLTNNMTEYQKAKVLYEWIIVNKKYDTSYSNLGYTGYGLSHNNTAVCQGYVAMYNTMCKIVGINIKGMSGIVGGVEHIWSVATIDGKTVYIDTTMGDPIPDKKGYCDFYYFDISEANLRKTHSF